MLCCDYGLHYLSSVFLNYIGILAASSNAGFSTSALLIFETRWLSWGLMLPPDAKSWLIWKDSDAGRDWGQEEKGTTEDEMIGWNHWLNGHEFEQAPGIGDGQGVLQSMGSRRVGLGWTTELNWTDCHEGCPVHYGMFNTFLEPCPLDASSTLPPTPPPSILTNPTISRHWQMSLGREQGEKKSPYIENHWSKK